MTLKSRLRAALGAGTTLLVVALAACSAPAENLPPSQAVPSAGATTTPDTTAPKATASPDPSLPPDPKVTKVTPVERRGPAPKKRIEAKARNFKSAVTWSDGVKLTVDRIEQRTSAAVGAGGTNGAPLTTFTFRLENGSSRALDATAVVVTATYGGKVRRIASAVYDERSADFAARLAPGKSVAATYSFSIPRTDLETVGLSIDLDSRHGLGSFKGAIR